MNAKELSEIKKHLKWGDEKMTLISLQEAYGRNPAGKDGENPEPHLICTQSRDLGLLEQDEEEANLYMEILKKSLSGQLGKNLLELRLENENESEDSIKARLFDLKSGGLKDEKTFSDLALEILKKGDYRTPVCIIGALFEYAAPDLDANREELEGSSSFRFLILSVCQAKLTEIGLVYSHRENEIHRKLNEDVEILPSPLDAILYPCFTMRASDVNHALYHCQKAKSPNIDLIEQFLKIPFEKTAPEQNDAFTSLIAASYQDRLTLDHAISLHEQISEAIAENAEEMGTVPLDRASLRSIIVNTGADEQTLAAFDENYPQLVESASIDAVNAIEKGKITIKAPSLSLSVKDDALHLLSAQSIDGQPCLIIRLEENMEVSGLPANAMASLKKPS